MTNKNNSQIILHYCHQLDFLSINVVFSGEYIYFQWLGFHSYMHSTCFYFGKWWMTRYDTLFPICVQFTTWLPNYSINIRSLNLFSTVQSGTAEPITMRGPQILLLFIFVVCVKSVIQPTPTFGTCRDDDGCPLNAECITDAGLNECECKEGFYPYDSGVEAGGDPYTLCARKYLCMNV